MIQIKVFADVSSNRLNLMLSGIVTKKRLGELYTELRFNVPDLKPGFEVVADLSGCTLAFLNIIPTFKNIMKYLLSNHSGEMVGILPADKLIYKQIKLATIFQGYKPVLVNSLAEAEEKLAVAQRRKDLRFRLHNQLVKYSCKGNNREGLLRDVSTGGCAVNTKDLDLDTGEEISIGLPFFTEDGHEVRNEIKAGVVRVEDGGFAVQFMGLNDDQEKRFRDVLVRESEKDVVQLKSDN